MDSDLEQAIDSFGKFSGCVRDGAVSFHTDPGQDKCWASLAQLQALVLAPWCPEGLTAREFAFFGRVQLPAEFTRRVLLAVELRKDPAGAPLYAGYWGEMNTSHDSHLRLRYRRFLRPPDPAEPPATEPADSQQTSPPLQVFGQARRCAQCVGADKIPSESDVLNAPCAGCDSAVWTLYRGAG